MGKDYFQGLSKKSSCDEHRPFFLLYGPQTKKLNGFGFNMNGKPSTKARPWFENPPAPVAKMIAPNSPDCMTKYIRKYGLVSMHAYFVSEPYNTKC